MNYHAPNAQIFHSTVKTARYTVAAIQSDQRTTTFAWIWSSQAMDQRTGWTLRVDLPVVNVNASLCEITPGLPVVKGGADAGRIARKRKVEYLDYQTQ
jgi:hypothetical protein